MFFENTSSTDMSLRLTLKHVQAMTVWCAVMFSVCVPAEKSCADEVRSIRMVVSFREMLRTITAGYQQRRIARESGRATGI